MAACPYKDVFIYIIAGPVKETDEAGFGDGFLGNWIDGSYSFLFFSETADKVVSKTVERDSSLELLDTHHFTYEQWQGGGFDELKIGDFIIVPPWAGAEGVREGIRIKLDPGVVFGNCLHPTTRDCLRALTFSLVERPVNKVIDIGTGTGILSIAAAKLGAKNVLGTDVNPLCVKTARKNVELNHVEDIVRIEQTDGDLPVEVPADMTVANVHYEITDRVLREGIFRDTDRLILSGLMRTDAKEARFRLFKSGYRVLRLWEYEMTWFTLLAEKGYVLGETNE